MTNNENIKEDWYGKWWNIIANEYPNLQNMNNPTREPKQSNTRQNENENFITKQLKVIREKSKADQRTQINTYLR